MAPAMPNPCRNPDLYVKFWSAFWTYPVFMVFKERGSVDTIAMCIDAAFEFRASVPWEVETMRLRKRYTASAQNKTTWRKTRNLYSEYRYAPDFEAVWFVKLNRIRGCMAPLSSGAYKGKRCGRSHCSVSTHKSWHPIELPTTTEDPLPVLRLDMEAAVAGKVGVFTDDQIRKQQWTPIDLPYFTGTVRPELWNEDADEVEDWDAVFISVHRPEYLGPKLQVRPSVIPD